MLSSAYRRRVAWRLHRDSSFLKVEISSEMLDQVTSGLDDVRLAGLFMDAQFDKMPADFCREKFGMPYPPVNVCLGGECIRRYREYCKHE